MSSSFWSFNCLPNEIISMIVLLISDPKTYLVFLYTETHIAKLCRDPYIVNKLQKKFRKVITTNSSKYKCLPNGYMHGKEKFYHLNGSYHLIRDWILNRKHGTELLYHKDGYLLMRRFWNYDEHHGDEFHFYPNGKLRRYLQWVHGSQIGDEKTWFQNGHLKHLISWKNGVPDGDEKIYWEDILELTIQEIIRWKDGSICEQISYYKTGIIRRRIHISSGVKHGFEESYYPNGYPHRIIYWNLGLMSKEERAYDENGYLIHKCNWLNGSRNGEEYEWNPDGSIIQSLKWSYGKLLRAHR